MSQNAYLNLVIEKIKKSKLALYFSLLYVLIALLSAKFGIFNILLTILVLINTLYIFPKTFYYFKQNKEAKIHLKEIKQFFKLFSIWFLIDLIFLAPIFLILVVILSIFINIFIGALNYSSLNTLVNALTIQPVIYLAFFILTLLTLILIVLLPYIIFKHIRNSWDLAFLKSLREFSKSLISFKTWILSFIVLLFIYFSVSIDSLTLKIINLLTLGGTFYYLIFFAIYYYYEKKETEIDYYNLAISLLIFLISIYLLYKGYIESTVFLIIVLGTIFSFFFKYLNFLYFFIVMLYILSLFI